MPRRSLLLLILGLFLLGRSCLVHGLELMKSDQAGELAKQLLGKSQDLLARHWEGKPEDARGIISEEDRIVVVPRLSLTEDLRDPEVTGEQGALLGGLFVSPNFQPLINGEKIAIERLPVIVVDETPPAKRELVYLQLAVRHLGGSDWRLLVFGKDATPLINTPFSASREQSQGSLDVRVVSDDATHRRMVVQVFGKYESAFEITP